MRETSYKCDRCGKPVAAWAVTKINMNMQKGKEPVEKKPFDFCSECFLHVKSAFLDSLKEEVPAPKEKIPAVLETKENMESLKLGPIGSEERAEILRLYVEEGLSPEQVAAKMNRLPRGVKRAINSAAKTGELYKLREEFQNKKEDSDISNLIIRTDSYDAPPQTEVINGKKYDVGGVLALSRAGWPPAEVAKEKHYDEAAVRVILDKYR